MAAVLWPMIGQQLTDLACPRRGAFREVWGTPDPRVYTLGAGIHGLALA